MLKKLIVAALVLVMTLCCVSMTAFASGAEAQGTITPVYTRENGFWGEGGGNAQESLVVELYEGENKIASASLNNVGGIIDGDVYVTWSIPFAGSTDEYWNVVWAEGYPKYDMAPTKGVMVIDGTVVAESAVQFNAPDNLNPIVALAEGNTGGVNAYKTLAEAMGKFNGRKVNVLRDVAEEITGFYGATLTTNVPGGVKITNTYTDEWIDFDDVSIMPGVTVEITDLFSGDSENVIEGTLIVNGTYYHGYNAKTTVQNGGKIKVNGTTILRYNTNEDAGLYIYGDNDDATVEFDCSYYIGAYSGTFYAEDANIGCGYFLLKPSYDTAREDETTQYPPMEVTLDNSSLKVVGTTDGQDSFIIDDQAVLTLKNGASIEDVRDFNILAGTKLTLSVDETSSISATYVNIAKDVPFDVTKNEDGTITLAKILKGEGTAEDPFRINDLDDLKLFRDNVNAGDNYAGKTVTLTADIDLLSEEWTPIGNSSNPFNGTFDGGNHIISNLVITGNNSNVGFFGRTNSGEIKNLTIKNAQVSGYLNIGVVAGTPYTSKYTNITVTGDVIVEGFAYVGGIGGKNAYADWTDITVSVNEGSYVKGTSTDANGTAYRTYVGGVIGFIGEGGHTFKNITSNINVIGDVCDIGGIAGIAHYGNTFENVSCSGDVHCTGEADEIGGIAGVWHNQHGQSVTMTDCEYTGTVSDVNGEVEGCDIVGGAYHPGNETPGTSGSLIIDGEEAWLCIAKIGETKYQSLAEALEAAQDGDTITLIWAEGDAPIPMNGAVFGKSVTITGTATVDWNVGFLFVGRGGEGNGTVIFDNANLTSASNSSSYGIHVSGREKDTTNKYDGTLIIKDSTIELDYLINRGIIEVDNSFLTVKNGFGIAGRPASETESGEAATATIDIKNGSYVKVLNHNGMGIGVASANPEGYGVLNLTDSTFECASFNISADLGDFNVFGQSVLKIDTLTGKEIDLQHDAVIKDSTVGGEVMLYGKVTFRGNNTFAMLYDYGNAYSSEYAEWIVEKGASVTLTDKARYGLGYGDKLTVYGSIEDALSARAGLTEEDISLFMHGLVAMSNWDVENALSVQDAYVVIGSNNSFGNSPKSGHTGTYIIKFENSVLDASRITFYEANSKTTFDFIDSDVKIGTFMTRDADSIFTLTNTVLLSTTTTNGTDEGNYHAGTLVLNNSSLTYCAPLVMENGTLTLGAGSSLTAPSITGTGKLIIDATGLTAGIVTAIDADASGFTGTIEVINNPTMTAEINEDGKIVLVHTCIGGEPVVENNVGATCTVGGGYESVVYCIGCGEELSREFVPVDATGHSYEPDVTPPTCAEPGYTTYTCHCGDSYVADEVPATGNHEFGAWKTLKAATCSESGMRSRECVVCGAGQTEVVPATGVHTYGQWTETKAPTCTEAGEKTRSCDCGDTQTASVAALGHTEVVDQAVAATCTAAGKTEGKHCATCNKALAAQEEIPALGHMEVTDNGKPATHTVDGLTEGKHCAVCNEVLAAQEAIPASGHSFPDDWTVTKAATETEEGQEMRMCSCGETETREIPALPASNGANPVVIVVIVVVVLGAVAAVAFVFLKKRP